MKWLVGLAALVITAALWFWIVAEQRTSRGRTAQPEPSVQAAEVARPETALLEPSAAGRDAIDAPTLEPDAIESEVREVRQVEPIHSERSALAVLRVRVVAEESGAPVAGVDVSFPRRVWLEQLVMAGLEGTERKRHRTDDSGWVELPAPPGQACRIHVDEASGGSLARPLFEPMAPGEVREIVVAVPTQADSVLRGEVRDLSDSTPIEGARVRLVGRRRAEFSEAHTDAQGRFTLPHATWRSACLEISAEGYGVAFASVPEGASADCTLWLSRAAELHVSVVDEFGVGLTGQRVEARTHSWALGQGETVMSCLAGDLTWSDFTDASGRCTLRDLPPGAELTLSVASTDPALRSKAQEVLAEPGEQRSVEFVLASGGTIAGVVVDQDGLPVSDCPLWRVTGEAGGPLLYGSAKRGTTTTSDPLGRFEFPNVPAGSYWVGVAPDAGEQSPSAVAVEVQAGVRVEARVVSTRGLEITGRVLEADGTPVATGFIRATQVELGGSWVVRSGADGAFRLKGLAPGTYSVGAFPAGVRAVEVQAGARDVILRLDGTGAVRGSVRDGDTGEPTRASVSIFSAEEGAAFGWSGTETGEDGTFALDGLSPGRYDVFAVRGDGRCGAVAGVEVVANAPAGELDFDLEPAAKLRVHSRLAVDTSIRVRSNGAVVAVAVLKAGALRVYTLPPGPTTVERVASEAGEVPDGTPILQAEAIVGEVAELVLE